MPKFTMPSKPTLIGTLIIVVIGIISTAFRLGNAHARMSFDLPSRFTPVDDLGRAKYHPEEAVMITVDEESRKELGIKPGYPMPRALQAKLLDRLARDGARIVFYDLIFDSPSDDPAGDEAFAAAMKKHGSVVLSGAIDDTARESAETEVISPPAPLFRDAARAWGLAGPLVLDPGNIVRRIGVPHSENSLAHWIVAGLADAPITKKPEGQTALRWLNYYGPAGRTIPWCSFYEALDEKLRSPGYFKGKIVCIGGRNTTVDRQFGVDEFSYPHARFGAPYMAGLEIHTTALLNLIRSEWLTRMPLWLEVLIVTVLGFAMSATVFGLPVVRSLLVLGAAVLAISVGSIVLQIHGHVWWNWLVPVAGQIPVAIVCGLAPRAIGFAAEARRRKQLREAFSLYLSPQMADRITEEKFDLTPGGDLVEATLLFTDCKGFTSMSEELKDPKLISETLIAYFTETSKHVLENDGTIIKYIGDAVFACWNAPVLDPDHAKKAARAGWAMAEAAKQVVMGRQLLTRVGVCTGEVVAGNLGSPYRFDYTCIGEAVNFASRLEGLNNHMGTSVLISDSTRKLIGDGFVCRSLGSFIVKGKTTAVAIHELIAPNENAPADLEWLKTWEEAMRTVRQGDFVAMQKLLREVVWQRGGTDGPSEYYLKHVAMLEKEGRLGDWTGVVKMTEK